MMVVLEPSPLVLTWLPVTGWAPGVTCAPITPPLQVQESVRAGWASKGSGSFGASNRVAVAAAAAAASPGRAAQEPPFAPPSPHRRHGHANLL